MYLLDRLFYLQEYDSQSSDGYIAQQLIAHLDHIGHMSLSDFLRISNLSKATLHRFYAKAGFSSFAAFSKALENEAKNSLDKSSPQTEDTHLIHEFAKTLIRSQKIYVYGKIEQIYAFSNCFRLLERHHIPVHILMDWDLKKVHEKILAASSNDLLVVCDVSLSYSHMQEYAIKNPHILNLNVIQNAPCQKYFIGKPDGQKHTSFSFLYMDENENKKQYIEYICLQLQAWLERELL